MSEVSFCEAIKIFHKLTIQKGGHLPSEKSKIQYFMNYQMAFDQICVKLMLSLRSECKGAMQVRRSIPGNSCLNF